MLLSVAQTGKYRIEEDWTQDDPEGGQSASSYDDPEAGVGGGFRSGKSHLTVETRSEVLGRGGSGTGLGRP